MDDLTPDACNDQSGMLLRDLPRGTVAELTDFAVAYWDGRRVAYAYFRDDRPEQIEEEFDPSDCVWLDLRPEFAAWLAAPRFSVRDEVMNWLKTDRLLTRHHAVSKEDRRKKSRPQWSAKRFCQFRGS